MSYIAAIDAMKESDFYADQAMRIVDQISDWISDDLNLPSKQTQAIVSAILSVRSAIKADSEMRMDNR